jgi:thiol-disulfide isomerase/thioredoxin
MRQNFKARPRGESDGKGAAGAERLALRPSPSGSRGSCRRLFLAGLLLAAGLAALSPLASFAADSLLNKEAPPIVRKDLNGGTINLAHYRGKVVLLNFWATWCAPCQVEMPTFSNWQRRYGPQGLQVVGISMDEDAAPVRRLVARLRLDYPVAMGSARLGERYGGVLGLPLTYLIDRNGKVRARFQGGSDLAAMEKQLRLLLSHP